MVSNCFRLLARLAVRFGFWSIRSGQVSVSFGWRVIQHYVFDRGGYTAICRRMKQFHALLRDQWVVDGIHSSDVLWSLEWIICTPCALHDCQNAFKGSMKTQFDDSDLLRATFIGCAAARNSLDVILAYQAEWVMSCLTYGGELDAASKGHYRSVCARLSVEPDVGSGDVR